MHQENTKVMITPDTHDELFDTFKA